MSPAIVVVIREDPTKSHRAVEALRIALGLSTGENAMTVVLLGRAPLLLGTDTDDVVDAEILEKHLPILRELAVPFVVETGAPRRFSLAPGFAVREARDHEIATLVASAPRVLVF